MTFSRFAAVVREGEIKLPKTLAGVTVPRQNEVVINLFADGKVRINGQNYAVADLTGFLQRLRQSDETGTNLSVNLRGDEKMSYQDLSSFMNACARADVFDVSFATAEARQ